MWKRFRSHISPKNDKPEFLSPSTSPPNRSTSNVRPIVRRGRRSTSQDTGEPDLATRGPSPFSSYRAGSPGVGQGHSDELGLHIIYQPPSAPIVDIIFVHGLGGASHKTWSKFQDPGLFWPQQWLPEEVDINAARIFTFGYNAGWRSAGPHNANIADFAKDILFGMKFGKDDLVNDLEIGRVPIIFVAHSMGGLVVKKAYLLGQNDENYQSIVKSITAVVFLGTPHRGTDLADLLNRMLFVSFQSPKEFIVDLSKSSSALEEINEQFRHVASRLTIFSFHETLATAVGPTKLMVLQKESSILGYPGEISKSMNADHHDLCKYASPDDPNYISVRNALQTLIRDLRQRATTQDSEAKLVGHLFSAGEIPEDDLSFFRQRWMPGTCDWILSNPAYKFWLDDAPETRIVWLNAPPASGKSILSAHIVDRVRELGLDCQYYFFKFADRTKKSTTALLQSLGLQMAKCIPRYSQEIAQLSDEGVTLEKKDARFIWQKTFLGVLSRVVLPKPVYWVVDALDEADSPKLLLELLLSLARFRTVVRVLFISRETESLSLAFDRLSARIPIKVAQWDRQQNTASDIRTYVDSELQYMRGTKDLRMQVKESILSRADGNFLWVHLTLEEILGCHTTKAISKTLEELPSGMGAMYERMEATMSTKTGEADAVLAKTILIWVVCAHHPLTLDELSEALKPEFPGLLDLRRTIIDICGQFVVVDQSSRVTLIHKTAREFLVSIRESYFFIDEKASHKDLVTSTISRLLHPDLRFEISQNEGEIRLTDPFLLYAATYFTYHIRQAVTVSKKVLDDLVAFLEAPSVLTWIYLLARCRQIEVLVNAAIILSWFAGLNRKVNAEKNPMLHRVRDLELFDLWATDLVKIVAKFGRYLLDDPTSIYKLVPPLCPQSSAVYQQFAKSGPSTLSVRGISNTTWNDCLARVSLRHGAKAWKIACAGRYFAVLSSTGSIILWDSIHFQELGTMRHNEVVTQMCFNSKGDRLVSYGFKTTRIWAVPSGQLTATINNPSGTQALTVTFAENDAKVLIGSDDEIIRELHEGDIGEGWKSRSRSLLHEKHKVDGAIITSPSYMVFNFDASRIAVAYRGYPLSVWDTSQPRLIGRCKRVAQHRQVHGRPSISWMAVDRVAWNPVSDYLVGVYKDGSIFKWNPENEENQEVAITADEISVSPDGKLFLTSDSNGTVKVWNFAYFSVIYQLSSENLVTGFAFSPDCKRFYDLREGSINAWEPNSLVRASENSENVSDTASDYQTSGSVSQLSEARVVSIDHIVALAANSTCMQFCISHENGSINLYDTAQGHLTEIAKFPAFLAVDHMTWGADGSHLAIADVGGSIMVKRLDAPGTITVSSDLKVRSLLTGKAKIPVGGIHQIILNEGSTKLLLVSQAAGQIWSIESGTTLFSAELKNGQIRIWMNHPSLKDSLLGVGPNDLQILSWDSLTEVASFRYQEEWFGFGGRPSFDTEEIPGTPRSRLPWAPDSASADDIQVDRAKLSHTGKYLLVQLSRPVSHGRTTKTLLVFGITPAKSSSPMERALSFRRVDIPETIASRVEIPLEVLEGSVFAFLDKDLWISTFNMESTRQSSGLKRHYFIPRDWASTENLEQCCMLKDGTFLCPKDGEVAIISSTIGDAGW